MAAQGKPDRRILGAIAVLHVTAAVITWRDLRSRPATQVRGDKRIWRLASVVNTLGSVAYWLFGRRSATETPGSHGTPAARPGPRTG